MSSATGYELSHLDRLESEAVHIFREVAATIERPGLLFSGGKDSVVMLHLAVKAFWPAPVPFPVMHVDTGQNFDEVIAFRDRTVEKYGLRLIVASVQDDIDAGRVVEIGGPLGPRNQLQTTSLLRGIIENQFGAVFGGARRDEEKARAKERIFSFRDEFGQWDPKRQRPELWNLFNGRIHKGENVRVFPISNWTELDVWSYIRRENIALPSIYFAHDRECILRDGRLLNNTPVIQPDGNDQIVTRRVRFRTVGDMTCTAAVESDAATLDEVVAEITVSRISERGETRIDDQQTEAAMEDRKKGGYF